jgi:predicted phage terminase large subunit-like protein
MSADCHPFLRRRNKGVCPICTALPVRTEPVELHPWLHDPAALLEAALLAQNARLAAGARANLATFFRLAWHVLEPSVPLADNWHLDAFGAHIEAVFFAWLRRKKEPGYRPDLRNVLFNVPPGTSKSRFISVSFNAWAWLHDPNFSIIALSANPEVAKRDADHVKMVIESEWYRTTFAIDWVVRDDKNAVGLFQICRVVTDDLGDTYVEPLGSRQSKGITAKITGQRADCILIDDPHDAGEISSEARRIEVLEKWDSAIRNRVNNASSSIRIGVMQRLAPNDWSAHVLKSKLQKWLLVCIPLHYDPERDAAKPTLIGWQDPRTTKGEILHPDRFAVDDIAADLEAMGAHAFNTQYNQLTGVIGGGTIKAKWLRWYRVDGEPIILAPRPAGCMTPLEFPTVVLSPSVFGKLYDAVVLSVDATFRKNTGTTGSEVGMVVLGVRGADFYWIEDHTAPMSYVECRDKIQELQRAWGFSTVYIENKANGPALESDLRSVLSNITLLEPSGGKEARGLAITPLVRGGHLYIHEGAAWVPDAIEGQDSITIFPHGRRDDRFDALTQALAELQGKGALRDRVDRLGRM